MNLSMASQKKVVARNHEKGFTSASTRNRKAIDIMDFKNNEFLPAIEAKKTTEFSNLDILTEVNTMPFSEHEKLKQIR